METRYSAHGVYRTQYHIVWMPKYRRRILNPGMKGYLLRILPKILKQMPGVEIEEINIQIDHVHTIMVIPPKYSVSEIMGRIKGQTASILRKRFDWLKKVYWKENIVWSDGYFVATIGLDEEQIKRYVKWQGQQDSGQAKLDFS